MIFLTKLFCLELHIYTPGIHQRTDIGSSKLISYSDDSNAFYAEGLKDGDKDGKVVSDGASDNDGTLDGKLVREGSSERDGV